MTSPSDRDRTVSSERLDTPSRTGAGADVTGRMTGTHEAPTHTTTTAPSDAVRTDVRTRDAKTSAAAVFGLVFGLSALFCALTAILSPAAVLFGIIGLVVSTVGLRMSKRVGVTGHGVALGGVVMSVLGLLLGLAVLGGIAVGVNSDSAVDRIGNAVDDLRGSLPSGTQLENRIEGATN